MKTIFAGIGIPLIKIRWSHDCFVFIMGIHIDDWVQDCSNSSALAMELLQSCTKP